MNDKPKGEREPEAWLARLISEMIEKGIAGGTIGPDGELVGIPNWEEVTKDQRFAQKAKTHGYPPGLAKSTRWKRDEIVARSQAERLVSSDGERERYAAMHEAMAWALDAERFLGAFNQGEPGRFRPEHVDAAAEHLILWLRERGYELRPIREE